MTIRWHTHAERTHRARVHVYVNVYIVACRCVDARLVKNPKIQNRRRFVVAAVIFFSVLIVIVDESYRGMREHRIICQMFVCVLPHAECTRTYIRIQYNLDREIKSTLKTIRPICTCIDRLHRESTTHTPHTEREVPNSLSASAILYDFGLRGSKKKKKLSAPSHSVQTQCMHVCGHIAYARATPKHIPHTQCSYDFSVDVCVRASEKRIHLSIHDDSDSSISFRWERNTNKYAYTHTRERASVHTYA